MENKSSRQYQKSVTGKRSRLILLIAASLVGTALIIGSIVFLNQKAYEPPAFEAAAVSGEPTVPEQLGYGIGGASDGTGFQAGLASVWMREPDGSLPVWFTNPQGNDCYILMRITRASDKKVIYESGLLKPGEYVEKLLPLENLSSGSVPAQAAIYSFDPENYHSLGTFYLSGTVE